MAMYCAAGRFVADAVGYCSGLVKALLLAGSSGRSRRGFGVFVVVVALDVFLRRAADSAPGMVRQLGGLAAMGVAGWVAFDAPVPGLAAKQTSNETPLDERSTRRPPRSARRRCILGAGGHREAGRINLISDVAVNGLPFVLLVTAALLVPILLLRRPTGVRARAAPVAIVVSATLLLLSGRRVHLGLHRVASPWRATSSTTPSAGRPARSFRPPCSVLSARLP